MTNLDTFVRLRTKSCSTARVAAKLLRHSITSAPQTRDLIQRRPGRLGEDPSKRGFSRSDLTAQRPSLRTAQSAGHTGPLYDTGAITILAADCRTLGPTQVF